MAKFIKGRVWAQGKHYPGYIATEQDDEDFLFALLYEWADYPANEAEALINSASEKGELADRALREDGFLISWNNSSINPGNEITLQKVGEGRWIVRGYSAEEMDYLADFAKSDVRKSESE